MKLLIVFYQLSVVMAISGNRWFKSRLLINVGLTSANTVTSAQDCINQCSATSGCSAVSYQGGTRACVKSLCGNLHMVNNNGWNTFVLINALVEGKDFQAPQFEWMLTDSCGLQSTGNLSAVPSMTLTSGTNYGTAVSQYLGKPVSFTSGSYAVTSQSSTMDVNFYNTGLSFTGWYYFNQVSYCTFYAFGNFAVNNFGAEFWLLNGGLFYNLNTVGNTCGGSFVYTYTPPTNTWIHVAFVYDPIIPGVRLYLNTKLVALYSTCSPATGHGTWNSGAVGGRPGLAEFQGSAYCVRVHLTSIDDDEIAALASSCQVGRLRFT